MKGLISGIKRMEIHDGDGLRTTVFFKGCSLKCVWCHNPESIGYGVQVANITKKCIGCGMCEKACGFEAVSRKENHFAIDFEKCTQCALCADACPSEAIFTYGKEYDVETLVNILLQDAEFFANGNGGVTLSGGECLTQPEFAISLARALFERGISVYVDSCGFVKREILERIIPYTDVFLYDIKAIDKDVHKMCTGQTNELILSNLEYLCTSGCKVEIRYPLVVGYNDGECEKIGEFLKDKKGIRKIKVLQYHSYAASRYESLGMENTLPNTETKYEDVQKAVDTLKNFGLCAVNGIDGD